MPGQAQSVFPAADLYEDLRGEADHRIANSLAIISSLVRVRARDGGHRDPLKVLAEVADRIETIAKLHRMVAHSARGRVALPDFLEEICTRLSGGLGTKATSLSLDCEGVADYPPSVALPLGLITAELVSNSLKYAHPAGTPMRMSISCRAAGDTLRYIYEDDGVGFPENFDPTNPSGMGMRFIHMLCQKLQTSPNWNGDDLGIRFEIAIPIPLEEVQ